MKSKHFRDLRQLEIGENLHDEWGENFQNRKKIAENGNEMEQKWIKMEINVPHPPCILKLRPSETAIVQINNFLPVFHGFK